MKGSTFFFFFTSKDTGKALPHEWERNFAITNETVFLLKVLSGFVGTQESYGLFVIKHLVISY